MALNAREKDRTTKLNRYEQAVYSAAHTIQSLCLEGVKYFIELDAVADWIKLHHL